MRMETKEYSLSYTVYGLLGNYFQFLSPKIIYLILKYRKENEMK